MYIVGNINVRDVLVCFSANANYAGVDLHGRTVRAPPHPHLQIICYASFIYKFSIQLLQMAVIPKTSESSVGINNTPNPPCRPAHAGDIYHPNCIRLDATLLLKSKHEPTHA